MRPVVIMLVGKCFTEGTIIARPLTKIARALHMPEVEKAKVLRERDSIQWKFESKKMQDCWSKKRKLSTGIRYAGWTARTKHKCTWLLWSITHFQW